MGVRTFCLQYVNVSCSVHCPRIGYTQGMSFICALALTEMEKKWAFWFLVYLVRGLPRNFFHETAQLEVSLFMDIIENHAPIIKSHFDEGKFAFSYFPCVRKVKTRVSRRSRTCRKLLSGSVLCTPICVRASSGNDKARVGSHFRTRKTRRRNNPHLASHRLCATRNTQ